MHNKFPLPVKDSGSIFVYYCSLNDKRNFLDGRLYFCPRASFGSKLGMPDDPNDFVDLRAENDRETLRRKIFELNQRRYIAACNYCDEGTGEAKTVPVAEQMLA